MPFIPEEKKLPAKSTVGTKKIVSHFGDGSWIVILADGCVPWGLSKKIHKDEKGAMVFIYIFFKAINLSPKFTTFEDQTLRNTEVTILTGFLGAGKTTLLNYILEETGNRNRFQQIQF